MELTVRKAEMKDIEDLVRIEESAIPGYSYVYDDRFFFLENQGNQGEMVLVCADGVPAGMGQYSIMPDGSGWLECLRVHKDYQGMGVGKTIYRRYLEIAAETKAPSVAMFTGWKNAVSKGLAEKNGLALAGAYKEAVKVPFIHELTGRDFQCVDSAEKAAGLLESQREGWGDFLVLNRTFMHYGMPLYEYLCRKQMVWSDGENTLVLGCRMLEERGWHLPFFCGDISKCLAFAETRTAERGLPELTVSFPSGRDDLEEMLQERGFGANGERIVMERIF